MDIELFMFKVMTALYNMNAPIVFKGAMVLKAIQYKTGNPSGLERETHDMDGDWCGQTPSMEYLTNLVQQAVYNAGYSNIKVIATREYGEKRSAEFSFYDFNGMLIVSMDLSIKPNNFYLVYSLASDINFVGQSIDKIVADKIVVISSRTVMRRIKDVIDLYILSHIWRGSNTNILQIVNSSGRELNVFQSFTMRYDELTHAYSKYRNKASCLDFNIVYSRVLKFVSPFINNINYSVYWNGDDWVNG